MISCATFDDRRMMERYFRRTKLLFSCNSAETRERYIFFITYHDSVNCNSRLNLVGCPVQRQVPKESRVYPHLGMLRTSRLYLLIATPIVHLLFNILMYEIDISETLPVFDFITRSVNNEISQ